MRRGFRARNADARRGSARGSVIRCGWILGASALALAVAACGFSTDDGGASGGGGSDQPPPGVTGDSITVGLSLTDSSASVNTGAKQVGQGEEKIQADAVIAYLNAHGGIAGHKVVPVYKVHNSTETNAATGFQADCAAFTEDNQVFMAYSTRAFATGAVGPLANCLAKHRTIFLLDTNSAQDDKAFKQWAPQVYAPNLLAADRAKAYVETVAAQGYFDPGAKVGLISFDEPAAHTMVDAVTAALKDKQVPVADTQLITPFTDQAGFGQASAQVASMVLRFKSAGIDHVMFVATYGSAGFLFPTQAETQHYRPRYALSTMDFPQVITANAPKPQLARAVGAGWDPGWDVDVAQDPGDNSAQTQCLGIMRDAGVAPDQRAAVRRALGICDALFFLKAGLEKAAQLTPQGLRDAVGKPDFTYPSAVTHTVSFVNRRSDGVAAVRGLTYGGSCGCFSYAGDWTTAP